MNEPGTRDYTLEIVRVDPDSGDIIEILLTRNGKAVSKLKFFADAALDKYRRKYGSDTVFQAHLIRNAYWPGTVDSEPCGFATAADGGFAWDEWGVQ